MMERKKKKRQFKHWNRSWKWLAVLAVVLVGGVVTAGTVAYLQQEAKLVNEFDAGKVEVSVDENFEENIKTDVRLTNKGNVEAYVRAKILVYYVAEDGVVLGETPVLGKDYTMEMGDQTNFIEVNGVYYFTKPLPANASTDVLIQRCEEQTSVKGRTLVVDVLGEAIQAYPDAVNDAWGEDVVVKDGKLEKKN